MAGRNVKSPRKESRDEEECCLLPSAVVVVVLLAHLMGLGVDVGRLFSADGGVGGE
jgi:hypothetical protein